MAAPAVPVAIAAVVALIAMMGGGKSATNSQTTDTKPKAKPYDQGVLDGTNDCTNGFANSPLATNALASGDAVQYNLGYKAGYTKGCPDKTTGGGGGTKTYKCMSTSKDAGITLAQAQTALAKLGYTFADDIGTCGQSTIDAVAKFQKDNGLTADGVIGPDTANKLKAKADAGSSTSYLYGPDVNGIKWLITQPGSTLWRGVPQDYDSPVYNTYLTADTAAHLKASIDAFAEAAKASVSAGGPRARRGRPHTPFTDRRAQFPAYVRWM